jgi:antitoxin (DNA-binding transcriptional repressor) of toxin-antitoxin stability system
VQCVRSARGATHGAVTRIGVRELRQNASRYLTLVKGGQTVEVSERGVLVALLVPPQASTTTRDRLVATARLIPASSPTGRLRSPHPVLAGPDEPTNQQLLDAERSERL